MTQQSLLPLPPLELRDYQQEALEKLLAYRRLVDEGHPYGGQRALVAMATGTGKTVIFAQFPRFAAKKVLVIAHREELLAQAAEKIQDANPTAAVDIEQAERHASPNAKVVVASIQTLAVSRTRMAALDPSLYSSVIVDEAHHVVALSYLKLLAHFGLVPRVDDLDQDVIGRKQVNAEVAGRFEAFRPSASTPYLVGFTATPSRTDGRGLEWVFDDIVFSRTIGR